MRKGYHLDVIELQPSGIVKVGTWSEERDYRPERLAPTNSQFDNIDNSLANKTFIILLSVPVREQIKHIALALILISNRTSPTPVWWRAINSSKAIVNMKDMA